MSAMSAHLPESEKAYNFRDYLQEYPRCGQLWEGGQAHPGVDRGFQHCEDCVGRGNEPLDTTRPIDWC